MINAQANRGQPLEDLIILANRQYRAQGIAVVHKVPTAWIPLRDSQGRVVNAKVEEKAAVDFLGCYRGRPLAFDAKQCSDVRIRWDRVEEHQAEFLEDWVKDGGIGFVLVGFINIYRFFIVPWPTWREGLFNWEYRQGPASISLKRLEASPNWRACSGERVVLDYLKTVDELWFRMEEVKADGRT